MPRITRVVTILNKQGLHARPAAMFVQAANKYSSSLVVKKDDLEVDGKSIMGILMLACEKDARIEMVADGEDAEEMLNVLERILLDERT